MQEWESAEFDRLLTSFLTWLGAIVGGLTFFTLYVADVPKPTLYIATAVLAVVTAVGWVAGRLLSKRLDSDGKFAQILCYSQLVTWLFPALGCCLAMVTWELAEGSASHALRMRVLSMVGSIASVTYGAVGIYAATI
jgi:hypothetical protein